MSNGRQVLAPLRTFLMSRETHFELQPGHEIDLYKLYNLLQGNGLEIKYDENNFHRVWIKTDSFSFSISKTGKVQLHGCVSESCQELALLDLWNSCIKNCLVERRLD